MTNSKLNYCQEFLNEISFKSSHCEKKIAFLLAFQDLKIWYINIAADLVQAGSATIMGFSDMGDISCSQSIMCALLCNVFKGGGETAALFIFMLQGDASQILTI